MTSNDNGENDMVKGNNNQRLQMIYGGHILYTTTAKVGNEGAKHFLREELVPLTDQVRCGKEILTRCYEWLTIAWCGNVMMYPH